MSTSQLTYHPHHHQHPRAPSFTPSFSSATSSASASTGDDGAVFRVSSAPQPEHKLSSRPRCIPPPLPSCLSVVRRSNSARGKASGGRHRRTRAWWSDPASGRTPTRARPWTQGQRKDFRGQCPAGSPSKVQPKFFDGRTDFRHANENSHEDDAFIFYTNAVRSELHDFDLIRAACCPPKTRHRIATLLSWWSFFAHFVNRIHDVLDLHLVPLAQGSLDNKASNIPHDVVESFNHRFVPDLLAEIELSRDLLANVENKLLLLSKLIEHKNNEIVQVSALAAFNSSLDDAIPHLLSVLDVIDAQLQPVYELSRLDNSGLRGLHSACAQAIVSNPYGPRNAALAGIAVLTRGLTSKAACNGYVRTHLKGMRLGQFNRSSRWVETQHYALVERANQWLRAGCSANPGRSMSFSV